MAVPACIGIENEDIGQDDGGSTGFTDGGSGGSADGSEGDGDGDGDSDGSASADSTGDDGTASGSDAGSSSGEGSGSESGSGGDGDGDGDGDQVLINEVVYDEIGDDPGTSAFTELWGPPGTDLSGWVLQGVAGSDGMSYATVPLDGVIIGNDGFVVIAGEAAQSPVLEERDVIADVDWNDGPDALRLVDDLLMVVDAVQYGDAGPNNAGEGTPAVDVAEGSSLTRDAQHTDSDDNATDFTESDAPTPGQ
jgi:hypothetical protein